MSTLASTTTLSSVSTARPVYVRVAALGFVLWASASVLEIISALVSGSTAIMGSTLPFIVIPLIAAGLLWRFGAWARVVAAVVALLMTIFTALVGYFGLFVPGSFFDFVRSLLLIIGALLALVGAIASFVQWVRGSARAIATPVERRAMRTLVIAMAVLMVLSAVLSVVGYGRTTVAAEAKSGTLSVEMKNFQFVPERLEARAGQPIRLLARNNDTSTHTFTVEALDISRPIAPGSEVVIEFRAPSAGTFKYVCLPHANMVGTLEVK